MPDRKVVRGGTHDRLRVVVPSSDRMKTFNVNACVFQESVRIWVGLECLVSRKQALNKVIVRPVSAALRSSNSAIVGREGVTNNVSPRVEVFLAGTDIVTVCCSRGIYRACKQRNIRVMTNTFDTMPASNSRTSSRENEETKQLRMREARSSNSTSSFQLLEHQNCKCRRNERFKRFVL